MATLTIRQATPDDARAFARMLDLFDRQGATPAQVAARMRACEIALTTWFGELDGQPVGFACLRLVPHVQGDEPYAELTDLYVDAPMRRRGVASALIAQVEAAALAVGARELMILTSLDNAVAQATYRASGYNDGAVAMQKRLPTA